jgi:hypothetical protein
MTRIMVWGTNQPCLCATMPTKVSTSSSPTSRNVDLGEQVRKPDRRLEFFAHGSPSSARSTNSSVPSGWRADILPRSERRGRSVRVQALAEAVDYGSAGSFASRPNATSSFEGVHLVWQAGEKALRVGAERGERVVRGLGDARDRMRAMVGSLQRDVLPGVEVRDQAHRPGEDPDAVVQACAFLALEAPNRLAEELELLARPTRVVSTAPTNRVLASLSGRRRRCVAPPGTGTKPA